MMTNHISPLDTKEQFRLPSSQRGYPSDGYNTQHAASYTQHGYGQSKGRIPDGLIRNQSIVGSGYRSGSAHVTPSPGYLRQYPIPPEGNRPGTSSEAIVVDMLGG